MRQVAVASAPLETGGCLVGYYAGRSNDAVVTHVLGPGPNARRSKNQFIPDRVFDDETLARLWDESSHTVRYIGDWHSHPEGTANLSRADRASMKHALRSRDAYLRY